MRIEAEETESDKINDVLIEMYSNDIHQEFSTFKGWKEKGFKVKKGSKGFFIWSKPLKGNKNKEQTEPKTKDEKDTFKFFGVAYIFSNAQVEPLKS